MPVRQLFATPFYEGTLDDPTLVVELERSVRALAADDAAGRRGARDHGYTGYPSYASLNDLPRRDPVFAELRRKLDRHVAAFAEACAFDLGGRRLKLDSLWVNLLRSGGAHTAHLHPHSVVSGTAYVAVPPRAGGLKLEDPRLSAMMAAPPRHAGAPESLRTFVEIEPTPGAVLLWESWLRHEVPAGSGRGERISVSFNYR